MKLLKQTILTVASAVLVTSAVTAKTVDTSSQEKDMRIMRGILESSLKDAKEDFPGRPDIKTTYLADQGYLFTVRLNGLGSFGIPGVASWDGGRLELDIPEIIEEAFSAIEYGDELAPLAEVPDPPEVPDVASELLYSQMSEKSREYQEQLRELREQQRELRRDIFEKSRDVRRAKEDDLRRKAEKQLADTKKALEDAKSTYDKKLKAYRTERQSKQINRSKSAIDAILQTVCDYGQTMRYLDKDEKFNLLVRGAVTSEGESADQMFIFNQRDIMQCKDVKKLRKNALYYTL